jgi:hypothetical protein
MDKCTSVKVNQLPSIFPNFGLFKNHFPEMILQKFYQHFCPFGHAEHIVFHVAFLLSRMDIEQVAFLLCPLLLLLLLVMLTLHLVMNQKICHANNVGESEGWWRTEAPRHKQ